MRMRYALVAVVMVGCGSSSLPRGGAADLANVGASADIGHGGDDMNSVGDEGVGVGPDFAGAPAGSDLSTSPDMATCGTAPGTSCCSDGSCPGTAGSGVTLTCMNHSDTAGVVDKRCMQDASAACGSFTQSCCNANGQPMSLGDYCSLGGAGGIVLYCISGTCKSS